MICVSAEHMIWYTSTSANINSLLSYNKDIPTIMQQRTPNIFHTLTTLVTKHFQSNIQTT